MARNLASTWPDVARLAAHLGTGFGRLTFDAVTGRFRQLPRSAAGLTPELLSAVLGARVDTVRILGDDAGTSERARLALTGSEVPDTVFVKMAAVTAATRLVGELGRLAETEVRFYSDLSGELPGIPKCYGSTFDPYTGRFILVLEDLAAGPCEFPDTLHPISPDQAALVIDLLARLHATFWGRLPARERQRGELGWVYSASGDDTSLLTASIMRLSARRLADRTTIPIEDGRYIIDHLRPVSRLIDAGPQTVMHGDAHPGNLYFREGKAGLLDWQAVRRGHPSRELSYTLITGMTTEDRREHQRGLLDAYRSALVGHGGPDLDADELWRRYRQAALYAYVAALATAGMGGMQDESIALEGLRRAVAALGDLDTVSALRDGLANG